MDVDPDEPVAVGFEDLGLSDAVLDNIDRLGFDRPTPIQAHAMGPAIGGRDIVGCAQTGTGKTAAFALPIIERVAGRAGLYGLVLAPTRELAQQIESNFKELAQGTGLRIGLVYGGTPVVADEAKLRAGVDVLIATPGRFLDLHDRGLIWEEFIEVLVLDEADRMLDLGFEEQLNRILGLLPAERQTLLFSATMPTEVVSLIKRAGLRDPLQIQVGVTARPVDLVDQSLLEVTRDTKDRALFELLDRTDGTVLVFVRTKLGCEELFRKIRRARYKVTRMHGGRSQEDREAALEDFRDERVQILVATEVAARGLDIDHIEHVINYDMPDDPGEYVHRIGRTGRAGAKGVASSLATPAERLKVEAIERLIGRRLHRVGDQRWTEEDMEAAKHARRYGKRPGQHSHGPSRSKHRRR